MTDAKRAPTPEYLRELAFRCSYEPLYAICDEIVTALESAADALAERKWRPIAEADKLRKMLVTNNIDSRDAFGQMSHVWIANIIESGEPEKYGKWVCFDEADRMVWNLTHCCEIPLPPDTECPECHKYVGRCPACHSALPSPPPAKEGEKT